MVREEYFFTSESVSEGHPDKVCDGLSDEIVDLFFSEALRLGMDTSHIRVAAEVLATTNRVIVAGEVRGPHIEPEKIDSLVRHKIKAIGYEQDNFHWNKLKIDVLLHEQSIDISRGVDSTSQKEEGAGDQGIMFGYACRETDSLMPAPIFYAHKLLQKLSQARHQGLEKDFGPDAKAQVTLKYKKGQPVCVSQLVVSQQQTNANMTQGEMRARIEPYISQIFPEGWVTEATQSYINPTGRFFLGGPDGDCGLTGRKIIVDTYGGAAPHGGGAFSGKDPTKVDRSAAYMARYLAKNIVAAELADRCTLQLSYAIGIAKPLSIFINLHGTGRVSEEALEYFLLEAVDLRPAAIRAHLGLNKPIYARTAAYGHFGRASEADGGFSWEKVDLVPLLHGRFLG